MSASFATVCSGIGAPECAWQPLGWKAVFCAEIEPFPSAVLKHHYPDVPNLGDFTQIGDEYRGAIDVLVGGTPCQDFSVAGLRAGMDGARGQLTIEFARLAERIRPRWLVWENVPGVLSSDGGRAFGTFLGLLGQLGYGFAYRIFDAQFFGVPQRRRRVFLVGHLGDWRRAAAVLFERHSLSGHPAPRREAGKGIAPTISARTKGGGGLGADFDCDGGLVTGDTRGQDAVVATYWDGSDVADCLDVSMLQKQQAMPEKRRFAAVIQAAPCYGIDEEQNANADLMGCLKARERGGGFEAAVAIAFSAKDHGADAMEDCSPTLRAGGHTSSHANAGVMPAVAIRTAQTSANGHGVAEDVSHTLDGAQGQAVCFEPRYYAEGRMRPGGAPSDTVATLKHCPKSGDTSPHVATHMAVRRLTPRECERLQGFPDDFTLIQYNRKPAADGPRYKALGNSMAVPVMRWIGERIEQL